MPRPVIVLIVIALASVAAILWWVRGPGEDARAAPASAAPAIAATDGSPSPASATTSPTGPPRPANGNSAAVSPGAGLDLQTLAACHRHLLTKRHVERFDCEGLSEDDRTGQEFCRSQLATVNLRLQELAARAAPCPDDLAHPSAYYQALKNIALAGDVPAQRCFIQGYFGESREDGVFLSQAERDEYMTLTRQFIDAAFDRGDWSVVRWLGRIRVDMNDGLLMSAYPMGQSNPETVYKMKYLLLLGKQADPMEGTDPGTIVEGWRQRNMLTAEQFAAAENWARDTYAQHFAGSQEGAALGVTDFCPR